MKVRRGQGQVELYALSTYLILEVSAFHTILVMRIMILGLRLHDSVDCGYMTTSRGRPDCLVELFGI